MSQPFIESLFLEAPPSDLIISPWQLLDAKGLGYVAFRLWTLFPDNIGDYDISKEERGTGKSQQLAASEPWVGDQRRVLGLRMDSAGRGTREEQMLRRRGVKAREHPQSRSV